MTFICPYFPPQGRVIVKLAIRMSGHFMTRLQSSAHPIACNPEQVISLKRLHCIVTFCQTNLNTTLDRVLSLVIIFGMGLDGGPTRHGDHTSMVSKNICFLLAKLSYYKAA